MGKSVPCYRKVHGPALADGTLGGDSAFPSRTVTVEEGIVKMSHAPLPNGRWRRPALPIPPATTTPFVELQMSPLEVLSKMAGGTTFRVPTAGRSTKASASGTSAVSHALGHVKDELQQALAFAYACESATGWQAVEEMAVARLERELGGDRRTKELVTGKNVFRIRLVLQDVFREVIVRHRPKPQAMLAKAARMRKADYVELYRAIAGVLHTIALEGATTAVKALRRK